MLAGPLGWPFLPVSLPRQFAHQPWRSKRQTLGSQTLDVSTLAASNFSLSGVQAGDSVSTTATAGQFNYRNAGIGKTVSASGLAVTVKTSTGDKPVYGYTLASTTASGNVGTIFPRTLAVTYTGVNRTYDGTTAATVTTNDDRVNGDALTIARTAALTNKNAGGQDSVTVSLTAPQ
jgi:hypothetical protein